ncbi:MAG: MogA/MoaB family molybdenum cofactor biosynthesis protein [Elusimicrobia bacterium]|nr:MogA/MoaB family molybdenum cofactor biosynthesis protein [Elusimicrobiota bacterium]
MIKTAILTVSSSRKKGNDESGKVLKKLLVRDFQIIAYDIALDDEKAIIKQLKSYCDIKKADLILTNGGTGFSASDITPEATFKVADKIAPGISELIRAEGLKKTKRAALSRGISAIRGKTLIINLPGSPKGVKESLEAIIGIIPHAIKMINDEGH